MPHVATTSAWTQMWCSPTDRHWSSSLSRTGNHILTEKEAMLEPIQHSVAVVIVQPLNLSLKWQNHKNITAEWMKVKNKPFWLPVFDRPHGNTERVCCTNPEMPLCIILKNKHANPSPFCSSWMRRNCLINYMSLCQWSLHCDLLAACKAKALSRIFKDSMRTLCWHWSCGRKMSICLNQETSALVYSTVVHPYQPTLWFMGLIIPSLFSLFHIIEQKNPSHFGLGL